MMVNLKDRSSSQQSLAGSHLPQPKMKSGISMPQLIKPLNSARKTTMPRNVTTEKSGSSSIPGVRVKSTPNRTRLQAQTPVKPLTTPNKLGRTLAGSTLQAGGKRGNKGAPLLDLPPEDKEIMDLTRRPKDKAFKHVFKGSVLITTLLEYNKNKFESREGAVNFAQKLLDAGHVQSVVASKTFDDGAALYRWGDESVVKEAKKMVATTASHIPKKRIIEMMDLQQGGNSDDAYNIKEVKGKFTHPADDRKQRPHSSASQSGSDVSNRRAVEKRYNERVTVQKPQKKSESSESEAGVQKPKQRSSSIEGRLGSPARHVPSPARSSASPVPRTTLSPTPMTRSPPPQAQRCEPITFHVQTMAARPSGPSTPISRSETVITTTTSPIHTELLTPAPIHIHTEVFVPVMTTRFEAPAFHAPARTFDPPVSTVQQTYERSRHETVLSPAPAATPGPLSPTRPGTMSPASQRSGVTSPTPESKSSSRPDPSLPGSDPDSGPPHAGALSTCRYDGIDMPALDIDNIDFQILRPPKPSADEIERTLQTLEEQSNCYSDNEKQLLEQMKKMKHDHESVLKSYEDQINELMTKMSDLKTMAEILDQKQDTQEGSDEGKEPEPAPPYPSSVPSPPPLPEVPQAPPLPPSSGLPLRQFVQPSKSPIKPRVKMRPLFWNRIILEHIPEKGATFWHQATEPNFDVAEFERLFGRHVETNNNNVKSLHDAMTPNKGKQQTLKLLDDNRSRAVGIKMRSMHCQMEDIRQAVYKMSFYTVDLDSLYGVYEISATAEELEKIERHLQETPEGILDQPEQFLYEIATIPFFKERIECMVHMRRFKENLFDIDQRLSTIQAACEEVKNNESLKIILELILAFGNYMNGGTQRGQADGFDLDTLTKIRDVKSMDNGINLLHYVSKVLCGEKEEDAVRGLVSCGLPDPGLMNQAAAVNFTQLDTQLDKLQHQLEVHSRKAHDVCVNTEASLLQPFKDTLDDFFESADHMLKDQKEKCKESKESFFSLATYLTATSDLEQITLEEFFKVWAQFFTDYRFYWKEEQKRSAQAMFEKVDKKRKERLRMAKRRKSIAVTSEVSSNGQNNNLKQRFANLRRRSEVQNPTFRLLRSQSVNNIDVQPPLADDDMVGRPSDIRPAADTSSFTRGDKAPLGVPDPRPLDRRARSDSDAYLNYDHPRSAATDDPFTADTASTFATERPPPLPSSDPPFHLSSSPGTRSPASANSYRREVAQPPGPSPTDGLETVFDRMERRRRRGVVVSDDSVYQGQLNYEHAQEPSGAHPLHDRIIRRRLCRSFTDEADDENNLQNDTQPDTDSIDGRLSLNASPHDMPRMKLSDIKARLGNRSKLNSRSHVVDLERGQRTLPAPPVPPRESTGEFIGSYNVQRASEKRAREDRAKREMVPNVYKDSASQNNLHILTNQIAPLSRDSRCSSPSSCSSHSSLDSSRPMRAMHAPRMHERTLSVDRDIGALTENQYRDALRKLARARAGSAGSLR